MRSKPFLLTVLLGASLWGQNGAADRPPSACPWLTEGSAAKALGADVRVVLSVTNPTQGSCTFVSTQNRQDRLEVFVGASKVPACPPASPQVTGIGDEAKQCRLPKSTRGATQMISGRVRNVEMAVTLSNRYGSRNQDVIEQIAEQVAGNLF